MTKLTEMEKACLLVMGKEGEEVTGATTAEDMKGDNMTCVTLEEFPYDSKTVRGVLSSLIKKGLADLERRDTGWPSDPDPDLFSLTREGIDTYFENKEQS